MRKTMIVAVAVALISGCKKEQAAAPAPVPAAVPAQSMVLRPPPIEGTDLLGLTPDQMRQMGWELTKVDVQTGAFPDQVFRVDPHTGQIVFVHLNDGKVYSAEGDGVHATDQVELAKIEKAHHIQQMRRAAQRIVGRKIDSYPSARVLSQNSDGTTTYQAVDKPKIIVIAGADGVIRGADVDGVKDK